eukprot:TRINITY_DN4453_c0_g1_i1.p1 TRINITY_DN4453_c0_g1~~TRINITY_DN4453_c0_g1_i1.p1  ORF type:complete len:496 (+),score=70.04 TRINITY_DN4453_c0_g1_i1:179-1666(+)
MEEEEFHVIAKESRENRSSMFSNLYVNGKYRLMASLYNLVHALPTYSAPFSNSPIYMLGKVYRDGSNGSENATFDDPSFNPLQNSLEGHEWDGEFFSTLGRLTGGPSSSSSSPSISLRNSKDGAASGSDSDAAPRERRHVEAFLQDFRSIIWFTYRKGFPPIEPSQVTTDIGWGCMLRTGQMILAHSLMRHLHLDEWQVTPDQAQQPFSTYRQLLRWFSDIPSPQSPYSLHNLVYRSKIIDIHNGNSDSANRVGEWFSPTRVCQILKHIVKKHSPEGLTMFVSEDGIIYRDRIFADCIVEESADNTATANPQLRDSSVSDTAATSREGTPKITGGDTPSDEPTLVWKPLLIMIPLRLGVDTINKMYIPILKALLRMPQIVGILGGRPKQSLYFVGYQDDDVIYLDPHHVINSPLLDQEFQVEAHHCQSPQKMPFPNIDPSIAVGFYCRTAAEFDQLCANLKSLSELGDPIISVQDVSPSYTETDSELEEDEVVVI